VWNLVPSVVHRGGWTPLRQPCTIVDMSAAIAVFMAAAALAPPQLDPDRLPRLPARGLALETRAGVELQTMGGRPLGVLEGLDLALDKTVSHALVMRTRRGLLFTLDLHERRVRRFFEGPSSVPTCRLTDARIRRELFVCGTTVRTVRYGPPGDKPTLRVVARAPGKVGHWVWAAYAPRGDAFFAQWSAECEVPIAFLVAGGRVRPYGGDTIEEAPESMALGWLPSGSAVIHFRKGACGETRRSPGIYAVPRTGKPTLLLGTPRFALYSMWGG
jgi:hypothetical protein